MRGIRHGRQIRSGVHVHHGVWSRGRNGGPRDDHISGWPTAEVSSPILPQAPALLVRAGSRDMLKTR